MNSFRRFLHFAAFLCAAFAFLAGPAFATIHYEISLAHPEEHLFRVTMTIPEVHDEVTVQMPAWNALYQIRDFASHVQDVTADVDGFKKSVTKLDKQTWMVRGTGTVTIRYATMWDTPGPFGAQLNSDHAFINPAMILMYVPSRRSEEEDIAFANLSDRWRVESAGHLLEVHIGLAGTGYAMTAPNYDTLADSPIEIGTATTFELKDMSPPITVAVDGDHWSQDRVTDELERICKYELKLMGGAPYPHYTFIFHIGKGAYGAGGGMEHANGTAINIASDERLAGVSAHEFFHLWNVKRIRPASLEPVDYTKEQYTRALWFAEGVTSTYGSFTLVRTGLWSKEDFYTDLGNQIDELELRPAYQWQSAEQSSLDAWLEKYPWYNGPDFSVSYYTKGQVLGDLLDILIRDRTNNTKSLDDVLRAMNEDFAKKEKPYRDSLDVRLTAEKIAGGSFEQFFQRYVAAADPIPYNDILTLAGLELKKSEVTRAALGFEGSSGTGSAMVVRSVDENSAAWNAGLREGDAIVSWDGGNAPRSAQFWVARRKPGEILKLEVVRSGQPMQIQFSLGESQEIHWTIAELPHASEKAKRIREGMLKGETQQQGGATAH